mmetsp:Transcript_30352/g.80481  ORF Transcript_30352/g.80481 Transcript_30352/m.80481 type:complete len:220 (+) Transcript_30352:1113-1772(+)
MGATITFLHMKESVRELLASRSGRRQRLRQDDVCRGRAFLRRQAAAEAAERAGQTRSRMIARPFELFDSNGNIIASTAGQLDNDRSDDDGHDEGLDKIDAIDLARMFARGEIDKTAYLESKKKLASPKSAARRPPPRPPAPAEVEDELHELDDGLPLLPAESITLARPNDGKPSKLPKLRVRLDERATSVHFAVGGGGLLSNRAEWGGARSGAEFGLPL